MYDETSAKLPPTPRPFGGLNSAQLRLLACVLMLLDHLWATLVPGSQWMTCAGRLAFPIFAFLIAEGSRRTRDKKQYAKRLFIAALLSEIPFNLMTFTTPIFPFQQNVLFTLLLGLWASTAIENARARADFIGWLRAAAVTGAACLIAAVTFVDYGPAGVLTVAAFALLRGYPLAGVGRLAALILINVVFIKGMTIPVHLFGLPLEFPIQGFAVLAILPIWMYNGQRGPGGRGAQLAFYAFYPVHMLVLGLLMYLG